MGAMCSTACLDFGRAQLVSDDVSGKDILEVGSVNVNGSMRDVIEPLDPGSYMGVDIAAGPGVDQVCDIADLASRFGPESFDVVVCTEVFEHVRDWRGATHNLKEVLRPGGVLLLTTRSKGFPYHGYPHDFWRYEQYDIEVIFSDMTIESSEPDPSRPGVFVKARRPKGFVERRFEDYALHSVVTRKRCVDIGDLSLAVFKAKRALWKRLPVRIKRRIPDGLRARIREHGVMK